MSSDVAAMSVGHAPSAGELKKTLNSGAASITIFGMCRANSVSAMPG